jgi:glutathione S-transferase
MKLELVSFDLCPYVQRSVITLKRKRAPFQITFIDLEKPPAWFEKISPLGKVPVLKVQAPEPARTAVIFESAVINEYLDETIAPQLHPRDPLQKAHCRSWIEYGSELLMTNYRMTMAENHADLENVKSEFFTDLGRLDDQVKGPYFLGSDLSLVDAAYAPLFMRLLLSPKLTADPAWKSMSKVREWARKLVDLPEVQESVVPGFAEKYVSYCREHGSLLF